jgi:hypothetical protein
MIQLAATGELSPDQLRAWKLIDSNDPQNVELGNIDLFFHEQHDILQPFFDKLPRNMASRIFGLPGDIPPVAALAASRTPSGGWKRPRPASTNSPPRRSTGPSGWNWRRTGARPRRCSRNPRPSRISGSRGPSCPNPAPMRILWTTWLGNSSRAIGPSNGRRWTSSSRADPTWPTTSAISFRAWSSWRACAPRLATSPAPSRAPQPRPP